MDTPRSLAIPGSMPMGLNSVTPMPKAPMARATRGGLIRMARLLIYAENARIRSMMAVDGAPGKHLCARSKNGPQRQIRRNAGVRYRGGARQSVGRGTDSGADTLCGQPEHRTDRTTPRYPPAAAHHPLDHPDRRR